MKKSVEYVLFGGVVLVVVAGFVALGVFGARNLKKVATPSSSSAAETSGSINSSSTSNSTPAGPVVTDKPTLIGNKSEVIFNVYDGQTNFPTDSFQVAISGLPDDADATSKSLYITCDDVALPYWINFWTIREGAMSYLKAPYSFYSGETIYCSDKQIPQLSTSYWYKFPLVIKAAAYDDLEYLVEIKIYDKSQI